MKTGNLVSVFLVAALAAAGSVAYADVEAFNTALAKANETRKQAGELSHEWRDTAKILKNAQKAAEEGDLGKATALVAEAQLQSDQAIVQADREATLWESRVLR